MSGARRTERHFGAPNVSAKLSVVDPEVSAYLEAIVPARRHQDAETLVSLIRQVTGQEPAMWAGLVGFGHYRYEYPSGRTGTAPAASFAARRAASVVYVPDGVGAHTDQLSRLGQHTTGVGSIYIKDLARVDLDLLAKIVAKSYATLTAGVYRQRARDAR